MKFRFADLVERVKAGQYHFSGLYYLSSPPFNAFPLRVNFELEQDNDSLIIEGGAQGDAHEVPLTFNLRIPFRTLSVNSAWAKLSSKKLGTLEGRIVSTGENFEFLAASPEKTLCAAHVTFTGPRRFEVSGIFTIEQHSVAFAIMDQDDWKNKGTAKIVSLSRGRE
jgi:hypothetical protein